MRPGERAVGQATGRGLHYCRVEYCNKGYEAAGDKEGVKRRRKLPTKSKTAPWGMPKLLRARPAGSTSPLYRSCRRDPAADWTPPTASACSARRPAAEVQQELNELAVLTQAEYWCLITMPRRGHAAEETGMLC